MLLPICLFLQMWHVYSAEKLKGITINLDQNGLLDPYKYTLRTSGGVIKPSEKFPFGAGLFMVLPERLYFLCSGTIISQNYILTSAFWLINRLQSKPSNPILVVLGGADFAKKQELRIYAKSYTYHKRFNNSFTAKNSNDIAVVRLSVSIKYRDTIKPIALPAPGDAQNLYVDAEAKGLRWEGLYISKLLVISNYECSKDCSENIPTTFICTIGGRGCASSRGQPLIYNNKQIGMEIQFRCSEFDCEDPQPGFFLRLTSYLDWVDFNTDIKRNKKTASKKKKKGKRTH